MVGNSKPLCACSPQVRGSIPILWEQIVDLSYKPAIKAVDVEETVRFIPYTVRSCLLMTGRHL